MQPGNPDRPKRQPSFIRKERPKHVPGRAPEGDAVGKTSSPPPPRRLASRPHVEGEDHTRIVIPRHQRGSEPSPLDIELREVRLGASGSAYIRVVPKRQRLKALAPGYVEATWAGSKPRGPLERAAAAIRGLFLGSPFATWQAIHERLSKIKALAVFSSDVLSSSAYATEEILLVLVLAGSGALDHALPIAGVIILLLAVVSLSYRQTIKAYPNGGGAYIVAHDNLGQAAGLIAAAALQVDYALTVAVSVAAGMAAVTSAVPGLHDARIALGVAVIALITLGNLRGIRESGTLFAAPTYFFIVAMVAMLVTGFVKVALGDVGPNGGSLLHEGTPPAVAARQGLTLFLILRAFSSGCAALTGTEAISNGVPAFKPPEAQNARTTLTAMALTLGSLFLGITFLANRFGLVPTDDETIVSKLGRITFGENPLYYGYQVATALVLFLAANTSFADFPRLSAILAKDRFMPKQFAFRGDRLAFSNGILLLAGSSALLLIVFQGDVSKLIPLYAVGVFVSFTLSQSGMVRHWWRLREKGWLVNLLINGVGAAATAIVALIIGGTKFTHGAWISILAMGFLALVFTLIYRHYRWFERQVGVGESELPMRVAPAAPMELGRPADHVIVPVDGINKISLGAVAMAREISSIVTAVHLTDDREAAEQLRERWKEAVPDVPLLIIESPYRSFVAPMLAYVESLVSTEPGRVMVVLPAFVAHRPWQKFLHNRDVLRLRPFLQRMGARVVDYKYDLERPPSRLAGDLA